MKINLLSKTGDPALFRSNGANRQTNRQALNFPSTSNFVGGRGKYNTISHAAVLQLSKNYTKDVSSSSCCMIRRCLLAHATGSLMQYRTIIWL